jgi:hypothetical protein
VSTIESGEGTNVRISRTCIALDSIGPRRVVKAASTLLVVAVLGLGARVHAEAAVAAAPSLKQTLNEQLAQLPSGEEGVKQIMGDLTEKLSLTAGQQKAVRPAIEQTVASMEQSRDRLEADQITPIAFALQIQMAGQQAAAQIEPILDTEQQVKYQALRQEQRRQLMQALQKSP